MDGFYGFVIVKDDAAIGSYSLSYGDCASPDALTSKLPLDAAPPGSPQVWHTHYTFNQQAADWAAVCTYSPNADWDIAQFGQASGGAWPECFGDPGAVSNRVQGVDLIVGDFHYNPLGPGYVHLGAATVNQLTTSYTEWDSGSGTLQVNPAQPVLVNMPGGAAKDRLWCYQVYLYGGLPYTLAFTNAGASDAHALIFENPGAAPYWAPRNSAILSATTNATFTPSVTGWHGVVVVNDNSQGGTFTLSILNSLLAADDAALPSRDGFASVTPNPARGPMRIEYTLARPARASFDVLDVAGRVVTRLPAAPSAAGRFSVTWDGRGLRGESVADGMYLLRMTVDGRAVETRKILRVN